MKVLIEIRIVADFLCNEIRIKENYHSKKIDDAKYLHKKSKETYYMFELLGLYTSNRHFLFMLTMINRSSHIKNYKRRTSFKSTLSNDDCHFTVYTCIFFTFYFVLRCTQRFMIQCKSTLFYFHDKNI